MIFQSEGLILKFNKSRLIKRSFFFSLNYFVHPKMIELDLSEIPADIIRKALCETIENQLNTNKYKFSISSASKSGENNFIGVIYRVAFSKDDGNDENSTIILKIAPQNLARRSQFMCRMCFLREIHMYNKVNKYFPIYPLN